MNKFLFNIVFLFIAISLISQESGINKIYIKSFDDIDNKRILQSLKNESEIIVLIRKGKRYDKRTGIYEIEEDFKIDTLLCPIKNEIFCFNADLINIDFFEAGTEISSQIRVYSNNSGILNTIYNKYPNSFIPHNNHNSYIQSKVYDVYKLTRQLVIEYPLILQTYKQSKELYNLKSELDKSNNNINGITNQILNSQKVSYIGFKYNNNFSRIINFDASNNLNYIFPSSNSYLSFHYSSYPSKNSWLGLGINFSYRNLGFELSASSVIDTIKQKQIDFDGDLYTRVAFASNINELVNIERFDITPHLSILLPTKNVHERDMSFNINLGLQLSNINYSSFEALDGTISYGGIYEQYGPDTLFSGMYDFYQNIAVFEERQKLLTKNYFFSFYSSLNFSINLLKNPNELYLNLGFFSEFGLNNILNTSSDKRIISYNKDNYNSMLYKYDFSINSFGWNIGLSYRL